MHQHRYIQPAESDRVRYGPLIPEVGQRDQYAVDLVAVLLEQVAAQARFLQAFDGAVVRGVLIDDDRANACGIQYLQDLLAPLQAQVIRKETAVADNDAQGDGLGGSAHGKTC